MSHRPTTRHKQSGTITHNVRRDSGARMSGASRMCAVSARKWLGRRDSNPTYLIQSQAFYR